MNTALETKLGDTEAVAASRAPAALVLRDVSFAHGELTVLDGVGLEARPGEVLGLVGPSGCGKTTLLELIAGLTDPTRGEAEVSGDGDAAGRLRHCAYMPQKDLLLPWLSAVDNAAIALRNRGRSRAEARAAAEPLVRRFGLEGFEGVRPHELSGGMRQRVAFARTVLAGKPVLLLDEPFGGLDAITRADLQEWLAGALSAAQTTVLVTHDVEEALYLCDRVVILSARPARVLAQLDAPHPRAADRIASVTSAEFVAARERAMEALRGGGP
jgi:NitT/TauT family transport system ATP-binding protein